MSTQQSIPTLAFFLENHAFRSEDPQECLYQILHLIEDHLMPELLDEPMTILRILSKLQKMIMTWIKEIEPTVWKHMEVRSRNQSNLNLTESGLIHLLSMVKSQSNLFKDLKAINLYFAHIKILCLILGKTCDYNHLRWRN